MKYRVNRVLLLIALPIVAYGQESSILVKQSLITFDLFSPFYSHWETTNNTPRWRLGYVRQLTPNSMIGLGAGFGNRASSLIRTGEDYSLWEIRPEYYRTFKALNGKTIKYFSIETFYINQREIFTSRSFFTEKNEYLTFERARYRRQKMGIVPKLGMFIKISGRFGLNLYSGVGVNLRLNRYDNFSGLMTRDFDEESYPPYYRNEGERIGVEFSLGAKLYVRTGN